MSIVHAHNALADRVCILNELDNVVRSTPTGRMSAIAECVSGPESRGLSTASRVTAAGAEEGGRCAEKDHSPSPAASGSGGRAQVRL